MYAHKPVKFARYLSGLERVSMHTHMADDDVRRIHLEPVAEPQAVIDRWVQTIGASTDQADRIGFIDDASRFAVYGERD